MEEISLSLVKKLCRRQFPEWAALPIRPVRKSGWDNRTFHLGEEMLIRMPSAERYACQVKKEQRWLPFLRKHLPLPIPIPLAMGQPGEGYPWHWSIYRWLEGENATKENLHCLDSFAYDLGSFLLQLQKADGSKGPKAGVHNFYRGGELKVYDHEVRSALVVLEQKMNCKRFEELWDEALCSFWEEEGVWVHGDVSPTNVLVRDGKLCAVIDFGSCGVGDPACDLAIAWTFLNESSRRVYREVLKVDDGTWLRGRGWVLWKTLISLVEVVGQKEEEQRLFSILETVVEE